ncbi:MAG: phosphotransferase [Bacteroidales bacterium]|nr:phosphotransferase [Bacteroidales bacterium]
MTEEERIIQGYRHFFGDEKIGLIRMPQSGSDRKYFRITTPEGTMIGAWNPVKEENDAFTGFTGHFLSKGFNVPEIYGYLPSDNIYFLRDLGNVSLYKWLNANNKDLIFSDQAKELYRKSLEHLAAFQSEGIAGLDLDLCYPHRSFDRQSMMWDMNYFKYMFLKLLAVPFNEGRLEKDFNNLADYLLEAGQDYFLYRDFQSANIMIVDGEPWFIDYQGGRRGAPQYDPASLLYDAKCRIDDASRNELLEYYVNIFCAKTGLEVSLFNDYFNGFAMIRLMQALGAFGFRGLYERKPTFTESIVPGIKLLTDVASGAENVVELPELYKVIRAVIRSEVFNSLSSVENQ